ncbi:MAG TPA: DUF6236 family protein [Chryseolinea sp.]
MERTILYYPTIDIPNESWLRNALLYWDEVASIVPKSHDDRILTELSTDILYLMDEGQFRPIKPEDLIFKKDNWEAFENFQNEFKEIVSAPEYKSFLKKRYTNLDNVHVDKLGINELADIHSNKTSDGLIYNLEELGLAKRNSEKYEWLLFEKNTGLLYMSILAKYLADIDSNQTTIGTDSVEYEKLNFKRVGEKNDFPIVSFSLNNFLPSPKENVPLEKIVDFKRKRDDNLRHFKKNLSDFQSKVSKSKSQAELKELTVSFQENLINGVRDLNAVLGDSKIDTAIKTIKSLINLKSPTLITAAGTLLNEKINLINIPISWASVGIATMGAIELSASYIDMRNKTKVKLRESPFSYVYEAQNANIVEGY